MGGHYWEKDGLSTPRMPTTIYRRVLSDVEGKLSQLLFEKVTHAIDGPGKFNHGDLDVLALTKSDTSLTPSPAEIAQALNAKKWEHITSSGLTVFAIPWPNTCSGPIYLDSAAPAESDPAALPEHYSQTLPDASTSPNQESGALFERNTDSLPDISTSEKLESDVLPERYIQLDLRIYTSPSEFTWCLFNTAHGDLLNIISALIRHKGLTITDRALYLRIADIEAHNKKQSRIELTHDPSKVLEYLGLDATRYFRPFESLDEMMRFVATCRFHDPARPDGIEYDVEPKSAGETMRATLNKDDHTRITKRPIFRYWYDTFLPAHNGDTPGRSAHLTREEVLEDAFGFFGEEVRATYYRQKEDMGKIIARNNLWPTVRNNLREKEPAVEEDEMRDTIKALKREVVVPFTSKTESGGLTEVQKAYVGNDFDAVITWSLKNHVTALSKYRQWLADQHANRVVGSRGINHFSVHDAETYTAADDEKIRAMKQASQTWPEILAAIGKSSKSQLIAHYKQDLVVRGEPSHREP